VFCHTAVIQRSKMEWVHSRANACRRPKQSPPLVSIDWNRARKRLQAFVEKEHAIAILAEAARLDVGHRAWLQVGGERVIFAAMQAAGEGAFRIGDRWPSRQ